MIKIRIRRRGSATGNASQDIHDVKNEPDVHLDKEIAYLDESFRSRASSITSPPSMTGSFYKKLQQSHDEESPLQDKKGNEECIRLHDDNGDDYSDKNSWGGLSVSEENIPNSSSSKKEGADTTEGNKMKISKKHRGKRSSKGRLQNFFRKNSELTRPIHEEEEEEVEEDDDLIGLQSDENEKTLQNSNTVDYLKGDQKRRGSMGSKASKTSRNSRQSRSSTHNDQQHGPNARKQKRRGSFGGAFRRLSLGNKSSSAASNYLQHTDSDEPPPPPPPERRRHSIGGTGTSTSLRGTSPYSSDHKTRRRSSLGSILGGETQASSFSKRRNSLGSKKKLLPQPPAIPDDYHIIIDRERAARGMYLFERSFVLDTLAQGIANDLASGRAPTPCEFYGNIGKGKSLSLIHSKIMEDRKGVSRRNILSDRFTEFGMGLALGHGNDGKDSVFLCQLFKE